MKKAILIVLLLGLLFWGYSFYKNSNFTIYISSENIDSYPYIKWGDITSGKLVKFIKSEDRVERIPYKISPLTEPIQNFGKLNSDREDELGLNYIELLGSEVLVTNK